MRIKKPKVALSWKGKKRKAKKPIKKIGDVVVEDAISAYLKKKGKCKRLVWRNW